MHREELKYWAYFGGEIPILKDYLIHFDNFYIPFFSTQLSIIENFEQNESRLTDLQYLREKNIIIDSLTSDEESLLNELSYAPYVYGMLAPHISEEEEAEIRNAILNDASKGLPDMIKALGIRMQMELIANDRWFYAANRMTRDYYRDAKTGEEIESISKIAQRHAIQFFERMQFSSALFAKFAAYIGKTYLEKEITAITSEDYNYDLESISRTYLAGEGRGLEVKKQCEDKVVKNEQAIIQLVIDNFPIVSENIPIDEILDFKNDSGTRIHLINFKRYLRKLGADSANNSEILRDLRENIELYTYHLTLLDKKRQLEKRNYIVTMAEKILPNRWLELITGAAKSNIQLSKSKVQFLEEEFTKPGKDVALIVKGRKLLNQ